MVFSVQQEYVPLWLIFDLKNTIKMKITTQIERLGSLLPVCPTCTDCVARWRVWEYFFGVSNRGLCPFSMTLQRPSSDATVEPSLKLARSVSHSLSFSPNPMLLFCLRRRCIDPRQLKLRVDSQTLLDGVDSFLRQVLLSGLCKCMWARLGNPKISAFILT